MAASNRTSDKKALALAAKIVKESDFSVMFSQTNGQTVLHLIDSKRKYGGISRTITSLADWQDVYVQLPKSAEQVAEAA